MKKKLAIILPIAMVLIILFGINAWLDNLQNEEKNTETESQLSEQETESNSETEPEEYFVKDEEDFVLMGDIVHLQEKVNLYEDFSLAEYVCGDDIYPALYDEQMTLIFREVGHGIEFIPNDTDYSFNVYPENYRSYTLGTQWTKIKRHDLNTDGVNELIISVQETGTGIHIQYIDIIDVQNQNVIPIYYQPVEFEKYLQANELSDEYVIDSSDYNYIDFSEDGSLWAEAGIRRTSETELFKYAGKIFGKLEYQADKEAFILSEETIYIEWEE